MITEGREGGTAGIYRPTGEMRTGLVDEIVHEVDVAELIFEAPTKASQAWFVKQFGPNVNLGNIPPDEVIPLETLRLGLRGDTLKEVLAWRPHRRSRFLTPTSSAMPAEEVLRWAYVEFGERLCLTCSWQKQSSVLVHMVSELGLPIDVIELDTQLFFRETYETRERARRALRADADPARGAHRRRAAQARGPEPLGAQPRPLLPHPQGRAARSARSSPTTPGSPASAATSRRRRAGTPKVEWSERYGVWKVHPLADWDEKRVWAYIHVNEIPYNPLHDTGYRSIGCIPCTRPTSPERGGARRPLGRLRQARMRHPSRHSRRRNMTDHIYAAEHPETSHVRPGGFTLWFTGLSGAGKTTIAHLVGPELDRRGLVVEYLDGDNVRTHLSKGLGFSKEDRDTQHRARSAGSRRGSTRQGGAVIAAAISPYEETRRAGARDWSSESAPFVEVYVKASVDECARRDVKGLYEKAFAGEIKEFTGVSDPYEEPASPELVVDTEAAQRRRRARRLVVAQARGAGARRRARWRHERHRDRAADRPARRRARRPHGPRPDGVERARAGARSPPASSPTWTCSRRGALSPLEGFMGQRRLRARGRGDAARSAGCRGRCRSASRSTRAPRGRARRARPTRAARRSPCSRSTRSTSTTRSARPSAASARPTRPTPASPGSTRRSRCTSAAA